MATTMSEGRAPARPIAERASGANPLPRRELIDIFLISFAGLLLEISYTRVISYKLFYYYTYLIIGLALLGIGSGAVAVAVSDRLRRAEVRTIIGWASGLGALAVGLGYLVVAKLPITTIDIWAYGEGRSLSTLVRLLLICAALFAPFACIGVMIAPCSAAGPRASGGCTSPT